MKWSRKLKVWSVMQSRLIHYISSVASLWHCCKFVVPSSSIQIWYQWCSKNLELHKTQNVFKQNEAKLQHHAQKFQTYTNMRFWGLVIITETQINVHTIRLWVFILVAYKLRVTISWRRKKKWITMVRYSVLILMTKIQAAFTAVVSLTVTAYVHNPCGLWCQLHETENVHHTYQQTLRLYFVLVTDSLHLHPLRCWQRHILKLWCNFQSYTASVVHPTETPKNGNYYKQLKCAVYSLITTRVLKIISNTIVEHA
jgi:hypothetical protein